MTPERLTDEYHSAFFDAYVECALWSSSDWDTGRSLDADYSASDIGADDLASMAADCRAFADDNASDLAGLDGGPSHAGHDFWLTRNRHGAGFWDRGYGARGERLTDAAHVYGDSDLYVGDDGRLYVYPC